MPLLNVKKAFTRQSYNHVSRNTSYLISDELQSNVSVSGSGNQNVNHIQSGSDTYRLLKVSSARCFTRRCDPKVAPPNIAAPVTDGSSASLPRTLTMMHRE